MGKKERKLSSAELRRKEVFERKTYELEQQGYEKKDLTIGVVKANILAFIIMLPFICIFRFLYLGLMHDEVTAYFGTFEIFLFMVVSFVLVVIHEAVHGITWGRMAKEGFGAIEFGFIWKMLTPYCTCNSELKKGQYILGAMMPTIIVGVIPILIAIIINSPFLYLVGQLMILGGGGDALIILKLLLHKENGKDCIYLDHPYECGVVVYERSVCI